MKKISKIITIISLVVLQSAVFSNAQDLGLFRTVSVEAPGRGIIRMSNTSFHSNIYANDVLVQRYGIKDSRIFSSITEFELGITNNLAFNFSLPYYADLFSQGSKSGKKTGAGDIVLGLRVAKELDDTMFRGFSIGSRIRIPEQLGYGQEPLGFRTFSYGKLAYSIEASTGLRFRIMDCNLSVSLIRFSNTAKNDSVFTSDIFYDTGSGYMGMGRPNSAGLSEGISQNQMNVSLGAVIPIKSWFSGILELNSTTFVEKPKRENILTFAPGFRMGKSEGFNLSFGMDYALRGSIPDRTFMFRFRIPTLSARGIKELLVKERDGREVRSKNALVAVMDFTKSNLTYLYEKELKNKLLSEVSSKGLMDVVSSKKVETAFQQKALVPLAENSSQLGVRLGANYIINAEIIKYKVDRSSSFTLPLLISFPHTNFTIDVQVSVKDLITGEVHQLGVVTSSVVKPRGVNLFPFGASSDMIYLSEPERRITERELIDRWVETFNNVITDNIEIFGWVPKQTEIKGNEESEG